MLTRLAILTPSRFLAAVCYSRLELERQAAMTAFAAFLSRSLGQELLYVLLDHCSFEEGRIHAGPQRHRIHKHKLTEILFAEQVFLYQLIRLRHHRAHIRYIPVSNVRAENRPQLGF